MPPEIELRVRNGNGGSWIKLLQDSRGMLVLDEIHRNKAITEKVDDPDLPRTM